MVSVFQLYSYKLVSKIFHVVRHSMVRKLHIFVSSIFILRIEETPTLSIIRDHGLRGRDVWDDSGNIILTVNFIFHYYYISSTSQYNMCTLDPWNLGTSVLDNTCDLPDSQLVKNLPGNVRRLSLIP